MIDLYSLFDIISMVSYVGGDEMLEVGTKLREEREKQGLTVQDIADKTHFNISQIEAIESGNLDYFKDDLSYVKFFVQFYCKALGMDFTQFKDEFEQDMLTYTELLSKHEIEQLRISNERLKQKVKKQKTKKGKKKLRLRMDVSVISMLVIAFVMIAALSFAFGSYIMPNLVNTPQKDNNSLTSAPQISATINNSTTTTSQAIVTEKEACKVSVSNTDARRYVITYSNTCDQVDLKVKFNHATWVYAWNNGTRVDKPKSDCTYHSGDEIVYEIAATDNNELTINMGYFKSNEFYLNDSLFELDNGIKNYMSGDTITFTLKGE